ncbi:MAG: hypothetical protein HXY25_08620 [Alphaproteobacteria bacterium]|nr:hypothetical protein [Alphaproteobacteria bacterium]
MMDSPLSSEDFERLKARKVRGLVRRRLSGRKAELDEHLTDLRQEFVGRSELEFFHAELIVRIRREIDLSADTGTFLRLWDQEGAHLARSLDLRWLVSAADTLVDHHPDPAQRALAGAASLFTNTVKLYETERLALGQTRSRLPAGHDVKLGSRVGLFDGLSTFGAGTGDMIRNLYRRLEKLTRETGGPAALILRAVMMRMDRHDTVFQRLAAIHTREDTRWQDIMSEQPLPDGGERLEERKTGDRTG